MAEAIDLVNPPFGKIKKQISSNLKKGDRENYHGQRWGSYDTGIDRYEDVFGDVLKGHISDLLKNKKNPIALDLMSSTKAISELSKQLPNKLKLGIAVSLDDLRTDSEKKRDTGLNTVQIVGDILESSTWDKIKEQLHGQKIDLIMERALAGFDCIPEDLRLYAVLLNNAWKLLSDDNGILIAEIPYAFSSQAEEMVNKFRNDYKMDAVKGGSWSEAYYHIKIVKTPNSPKNLPFK